MMSNRLNLIGKEPNCPYTKRMNEEERRHDYDYIRDRVEKYFNSK